uniref:TIR domain-containing protein n=1 Tax=Glossina brevipalpis TaxID=37001 RepID=A0A1A9WXK1_9MUSC
MNIDAFRSLLEDEIRAIQNTPLTALSKNTKLRISAELNRKKIIRSERGYQRDWRGLALLAVQKNYCEENILCTNDDPTMKILQLWCSNSPKTATFAYLGIYLGQIDRWDIYYDIYKNLVEDSKIYQQQTAEILNKDHYNAKENNQSANLNKNFEVESGSKMLTKDDVVRAQNNLPPQNYNAFVLFAEKDINYAVEMIDKLEKNSNYNLKLCIKHRDLLTGLSFEHVALMELIQARCKHLIVILTKEFLKSPENEFLVNYTQVLQMQNKGRKIIPLLYEDGVDTPLLKVYTHMRYGVSNSLFDFWPSLATSIRNVDLLSDEIPSATKCFPRSQSEVTNSHSSPEIANINLNEQNVMANQKLFKSENINSNTLTDNATGDDNDHFIGNLPITSKSDNAANMFELSVRTSTGGKKKKKKWPNNLFEKVFSLNTAKLKETV